MHRRRRAAIVAIVGMALLAPWMIGPAHAVDSTSATTMAGPGSSLDGMFLTYVGCDDFGAPATAPSTRINRGPDIAPLGSRSFGLVPSGPGTASGPTVSFLSLASLGAGVDVRSQDGTTGVSYIWVTALDAPAGHAWRGRASLAVTPGTWQHIDTTSVRHDWDLVDLTTGLSIAAESSTPGEFVAAHGDGAGYVVTGFGCNANAFNLDAVGGNGRTWDFEGLSLKTAILTSSPEVAVGGELSVIGSVTDPTGRVTGDPLILQSRAPGAPDWTDVSPLTYTGPDGRSQATIRVTEARELRWLRPESEYADAGASETVLVNVKAAPAATPPPVVTPSPVVTPEPAMTPEQAATPTG